jgi:hypothetical protein
MTFKLSRALTGGIRRSVSTSGFVVLVLTVLSQFAIVVAMNTLIAEAIPDDVPASQTIPIGLTAPVSSTVATALGVVAFLFGLYVVVLAARLLTRETRSLATLPAAVFTRRFVRAYLSIAVVSILLAIAIPLGFSMLFVPGIFLAVSFQFAVFAVAVEDAGPIDALRRSWDLSNGNRWRLFGLLMILLVLSVTGNVVGTAFTLANRTTGQLLSILVNATVLLCMYGVISDAFVQLANPERNDADRL